MTKNVNILTFLRMHIQHSKTQFLREHLYISIYYIYLFILRWSLALHTQAGIAVAQSWLLTTTSASQVQAILLPQPPE